MIINMHLFLTTTKFFALGSNAFYHPIEVFQIFFLIYLVFCSDEYIQTFCRKSLVKKL